jgi:hypothetical protein
MPFMPEMFAFCGQRFRVYKRAHKGCDTVFPTRMRRISDAVHLETRCSGAAHGGCQAACLIYWKQAWLKPVSAPLGDSSQTIQVTRSGDADDEQFVWRAAHRQDVDAVTAYVCQATRLPYASTSLEWWDLRQYVEDYVSGNVGIARLVQGLTYSSVYTVMQAGVGLGAPLRWLYDRFHWLWGGPRFPRRAGAIPMGTPTPHQELNLQPGELVRVKAHDEILKTVNTFSLNRGLSFDAEMVPYCGRTYKVRQRVTKLLDEKTGRMLEMKTPSIILDAVICESRYSWCRMLCPRSIFPYWREIWLERVGSSEHEHRSSQ